MRNRLNSLFSFLYSYIINMTLFDDHGEQESDKVKIMFKPIRLKGGK